MFQNYVVTSIYKNVCCLCSVGVLNIIVELVRSQNSKAVLPHIQYLCFNKDVFLFVFLIHRDAPPLLPSDTTQGYRTVKAKLGCKKVRPWKWMPFTNPARRDGAIFHHWRRVAEEGKDYPFARFNKVGMTIVCLSLIAYAVKISKDGFTLYRSIFSSLFIYLFSLFSCFLPLQTVQVPVYSEQEYQMHLHDDGWTKAETDHLFDLCKRFDLRFIVVHDRYDHQQYRVIIQ